MFIQTVVGWICVIVGTAGCGKSPVSVENHQTITHKAWGYTMGLPDSLLEGGWTVVTEKNLSKYDLFYTAIFQPPTTADRLAPFIVKVQKGPPVRYASAAAWAKEQEPTAEQLQQLEVLDASTNTINIGGADAVETVGRWVSRQGHSLRFYYVVFAVHQDITIEMDGSFNVGIGNSQTVEDLIDEWTQRWVQAVPKYRAIAQTLEFSAP